MMRAILLLLILISVTCAWRQLGTYRSSKSATSLFAKKKTAAVDEVTVKKEDTSNDSRLEALSGVLHQIERCYGKGSIQKLGQTPSMNVAVTPSGSMTLDMALGGGYPRGRVVEIYGPESSGKTTLALHAVAEIQKAGGQAAFIDAEHALDPVYARNLGVNVDDLLVCQPDSGEMALDVVDQLVRSSAVDVIVVDSVAALVPRAELEGDMTDTQMGLQARLMSKALRKITGSLSRSQTTVIFINQLRSKIGIMYGNPEVTAGGNALKFYSSVRIDIRRKEVLKDNQGIMVRTKVVKNKVAPPFRVVEFDILFGSGIDKYGCLLDAAESCNIVERKGSWYNRGELRFAQGRRPAIEFLKTNQGIADEIDKEVREYMAKKIAALPGTIGFDDDENSENGGDMEYTDST
jgi:recombination protein RecA